jgi:hypothetical protein
MREWVQQVVGGDLDYELIFKILISFNHQLLSPLLTYPAPSPLTTSIAGVQGLKVHDCNIHQLTCLQSSVTEVGHRLPLTVLLNLNFCYYGCKLEKEVLSMAVDWGPSWAMWDVICVK